MSVLFWVLAGIGLAYAIAGVFLAYCYWTAPLDEDGRYGDRS